MSNLNTTFFKIWKPIVIFWFFTYLFSLIFLVTLHSILITIQHLSGNKVSESFLNRTLTVVEFDVGTVIRWSHPCCAWQRRHHGQGWWNPLLGDDDLLLTREFVSGTTKSLDRQRPYCRSLVRPDGNRHLANVNDGKTLGLTPGTTHTLLQSIGTGARQHLYLTYGGRGRSGHGYGGGRFHDRIGDVLARYGAASRASGRKLFKHRWGNQVVQEIIQLGSSRS